MTTVELWLLGKLLSLATDATAKKYYLAELKSFETAESNPFLKAVIAAVETLLA